MLAGFMNTNYFDLSTPLLLAAKAMNHTGIQALKPLKDVIFKLFALTFLVSFVKAIHRLASQGSCAVPGDRWHVHAHHEAHSTLGACRLSEC